MTRLAPFAAVLVSVQIGLAVEARAVEPVFPLGRETTYVDGPLDEEGFVDYAEALNEHYCRGVTSKNNVYAGLWEVIGPQPISQEVRTTFFRLLSIEVPPAKGNYFVTFRVFVLSRVSDPAKVEAAIEQLTSAAGRPWTADEFPHVAEWLNAVDEPLALMVEALIRPRYFRPIVPPTTPKSRGTLIESPIFGNEELRDLARALNARAMSRTAEGKFAEAWDDLLRCRRLGRLVSSGPMLVDLMVGHAIEAMAAGAEVRYVERRQGLGVASQGLRAASRWTAEAAAAHLDDLDRLPASTPWAEILDRAERFAYLDMVRLIRSGGLDPLNQSFGAAQQDVPSVFRELMVSADYRPALRNGNRWYDRLVRAARMNRAARRTEFDRIDDDIKQLIPSRPWGRTAFWLGLFAGTPPTRGERIGDYLAMLMLPALQYLADMDDAADQRLRNVKIAIAFAAFRDETGRYPAKLDELVPKYLPAVPLDRFTDKPPVYRPNEKGYLLYSLGPDGKDNEGRSQDDDRDKDYGFDDITIRMPIP